jgi:hypothetical protein
MFCPKCGTPGKGKRFCTRCGLQLALVRYQGVAVTRRIPVANPSAPTIRVESHLVTQKFAAPTLPNEVARVTTVATIRLRPVVATSVKPVLIGALLLLMFTASGFWWRKNQGNIVQAQTVALIENRQTDSGNATPTQVNGHNPPAGDAQTEPVQAPVSNYDWAIIEDQTRGVSKAEDSLLADEQMAVIGPGGQLALDLRSGQFFGDGPQADLQIFGMAQERVSYTLFVRNDSAAAWQRVDVNRKTFPAGVAGHDMGHHGIRQAKQVLIYNDAQNELRIDAVTAKYQDIVSSSGGHQHLKPLRAQKTSAVQPTKHKRAESFLSGRRTAKSVAICLKKHSRDSDD